MTVMTQTTDWTQLSRITEQSGGLTTRAPAPVLFQGTLYLFFQGVSDEGAIYVTRSSAGQLWSRQTNISSINGAHCATGLAPIVFGHHLYVFFRSHAHSDKIDFFRTSNGEDWEAPKPVFTSEKNGTSMAPAPVVYRDRLYVFYRGRTEKTRVLAYSTSDGVNWVGQLDVTAESGLKVATVPIPFVFDDRLLVFGRTASDDTRLELAHLDAEGHWGLVKLTDQTEAKVSRDPVPVIWHETVYLFFVGRSNEGRIYFCTSVNGLSWETQSRVDNDARTHETPEPVVDGDRLFVFFRGRSDAKHVNVFSRTDQQDWGDYTSISERNHASTDGSLQAVVTPDNGIVVTFRSTEHDDKGLAAFGSTSRTPWQTRLAGVPAVVAAVKDDGVRAQCYAGGFVWNPINHFQTMVAYRDWFLLTRNRMGESAGDLYVVDRFGIASPRTMKLDVGGSNHPGGSQVIGDFLAVSMGNLEHGRVAFYDLSVMTDTRLPQLLSTQVRLPEDVGAVGITDVGDGDQRRYVLGAYTDGHVLVYTSNAVPLDAADCKFTFEFSAGVGKPGPDSMSLLTDRSGAVYLLSLATKDDELTEYEDWVYLYKIDVAGRSINRVAKRMFYTKAGLLPPRAIHFRFGAGATVVDTTALEIYASDRNTEAGYLDYSYFR